MPKYKTKQEALYREVQLKQECFYNLASKHLPSQPLMLPSDTVKLTDTGEYAQLNRTGYHVRKVLLENIMILTSLIKLNISYINIPFFSTHYDHKQISLSMLVLLQ